MARCPPSVCLLCLVGGLVVMSPARGNDLAALDHALAGTGFAVESLLRRAETVGQGGIGQGGIGQGGPFIAAPSQRALPEVGRRDRLWRALAVLPLAAPLAAYEISSGFGRRRDPFNRRAALHAGIDLRAPPRSTILATAPGRVVFAGRRGGYGRMVEIDHGLGVHTRYAHLALIAVRPGQNLPLGGRIGLLGNSGRSTGPHLHYEVLVDGRPRNPHPFLKAGRRLNQGTN